MDAKGIRCGEPIVPFSVPFRKILAKVSVGRVHIASLVSYSDAQLNRKCIEFCLWEMRRKLPKNVRTMTGKLTENYH